MPDSNAFATYRGQDRDGLGCSGRLGRADVEPFVRRSFRRGWRVLTVVANGHQIGGIIDVPGNRLWWSEVSGGR